MRRLICLAMFTALSLLGCDRPTAETKGEPGTNTEPARTPESATEPAKVAVTKRPKPGPAELAAKPTSAPVPTQAERAAFSAALGEGRAQTKTKNYSGAVESFERALAVVPRHPRALMGRGHARLLAGDLDGAQVDLELARALVTEPALRSTIAYDLGLVAEARDADDEALRWFREADTLDPTQAAKDKIAAVETAAKVDPCAGYIREHDNPAPAAVETWGGVHELLAKRIRLRDPTAAIEAPRDEAEAEDWLVYRGCGKGCSLVTVYGELHDRGRSEAHAIAVVRARPEGGFVVGHVGLLELPASGVDIHETWELGLSRTEELLVVLVKLETLSRDMDCWDEDDADEACWGRTRSGRSREDVILDAETLETKLVVDQYWDPDAKGPGSGAKLNVSLAGRKVMLGGACRADRQL